MATAPAFFDKAMIGRARLTTAETTRDGSGANLVSPTWIGAGTGTPDTDWLLKRIVVRSNNDAADCIVTVYATDASDANPRIFAEIDLGNPAAGSATDTAGGTEVVFGADFTFPAECSLRFGVTATPTAGSIDVTAFCERA
jgi:hypothetical protein